MQKTQEYILRHHGGDGDRAREMTIKTYADRFDADFWNFWDEFFTPVIKSGDGLMDLGAGVGLFIKDLADKYPESHVLGVDAVPYMLDYCVDLSANARMCADDLNDPQVHVVDGTVAGVMCSLVVHELIQPVLMFQAVYRWLKPGGRFCVIDLVRQPLEDYLNHKYPDSEISKGELNRLDLEDAFEHFLEHNRYHAADLIYMLEALGFKLIDQSEIRNGRMVRLVVEKPES